MQIIYIVEIILMFIIFMLLHKTNKKERVILWITLFAVSIICYNVFICLMFKIINIQCSLVNLSIINILIIILGIAKIIKDKKIQKYYIHIQDIIIPIILLLIILGVAYKHFGYPPEIKYKITDSATHYRTAMEFYQKQELLQSHSNTDIMNLFNLSSLMPASYVNIGIAFNISSYFIQEDNFYIIYILYDICMLYLAALLMYILLTMRKTQNKKMCIISAILAIIYALGYPLNSMQSGFSYLSIGLNIILAILITINLLKLNKLKNPYIIAILSLLNFGIFFSYYLFVPIIYLAEFIWLLREYKKKENKIINIKSISTILITLVVPAIYGIYYFVLIDIIQGNIAQFTKISTPGDVYTNYISNFILFIPLIIMYIIHNIHKNKIEVWAILVIIAFTIIAYIAKICGIVSEYYLMKLYYIAWIFAIIATYKEIDHYRHKTKIITTIGIIYIILLVISLNFQNLKISSLYDIYKTNLENTNEANLITDSQKELVKYYKNNLQSQENNIDIYSYNNIGTNWWLYNFFENPYFIIGLGLIFWEEDVEQWLNETEKQYYILLTPENIYDHIDKNSNEYNILFINNSGAILERK